jgi:hypothetical protein
MVSGINQNRTLWPVEIPTLHSGKLVLENELLAYREPRKPESGNYLLAQWGSDASNLRVKNIQVIDSADNCVYDIFAATEEEFSLIFPDGEDIAFNEQVWARGDSERLTLAFEAIWKRRIRKRDAMGIHGVLFYGLSAKSVYYPTRRDEEAINPDGSLLR